MDHGEQRDNGMDHGEQREQGRMNAYMQTDIPAELIHQDHSCHSTAAQARKVGNWPGRQTMHAWGTSALLILT